MSLKSWWRKRKERREKALRDNGYGWAAGVLLSHESKGSEYGQFEVEAMTLGEFDNHDGFDKGANEALHDWNAMQRKATNRKEAL